MTRPLYLIVSAIALIALVGSVALVFSHRPADGTVAGDQPTQAIGSSDSPDATADGTSTRDPGQPTDDQQTPDTPPPTPTATATPSTAKQVGAQSVEPEELTGYVWPARHALITSRFAPRDVGGFVIIDGREVHDGLDLATHCRNKVRAAHDGTVLYAGRNFDPYIGYRGDAAPIWDRLVARNNTRSQPIVVVIDDGNGYRSMYVHLDEAQVEAGQVVEAGDVIGLEGATGFATGCHLHYTLIRMDGPWQPVVPRLAQFGYPSSVRERVNPLRVLPWGDTNAPQRLQDRFNNDQPGE